MIDNEETKIPAQPIPLSLIQILINTLKTATNYILSYFSSYGLNKIETYNCNTNNIISLIVRNSGRGNWVRYKVRPNETRNNKDPAEEVNEMVRKITSKNWNQHGSYKAR